MGRAHIIRMVLFSEVLFGEAERSRHDPLGHWHSNETIHLLRRSSTIDCVGRLGLETKNK